MNKRILVTVVVLAVLVAGAIYYVYSGVEAESEKYASYSPGEYIVTNVSESNRLLKTSVVLVLNTDRLQGMLEEQNSLIRDKLIFILRDLDEEAIMDKRTIEPLRLRIIDSLNECLGIDNIVEVRFNDFVMQ